MAYTFHAIHPLDDAQTVRTVQEIINMSKGHGEEVLASDFNPDLESLLATWQSGVYKVFAVKSGPTVVGYSVWSITVHPFKKHETDAIMIATFITKEHRGKGAFGLLLEEGRKAVKYAGATRVAVVIDDGHPMQIYFEAKGWTQPARIFQEPK